MEKHNNFDIRLNSYKVFFVEVVNIYKVILVDRFQGQTPAMREN